MRINLKHSLAALLALSFLVSCSTSFTHTNNSTQVACNRSCLIKVAKTYLAAIVAHNPAAAPLAKNIHFVENIKPMEPGQGLWKTARSGPTRFAIYVPDPVNQTVGFMGMMTYMAAPPAPRGASPEKRAELAATAKKTVQPVLVAIRLKLVNGKITEAEHLLATIRKPKPGARKTGRPTPWDNLQTPRPGLLAKIPVGERMAHDKLIKTGASYYDALDDNDGSLAPFAADCERHENGMITAGPHAGPGPNNAGPGGSHEAPIAHDCAGQLSSKVMTYIDTIGNRRVFAADPVTGLVMGLSQFHQSMDKGPYEVIHVDGSKSMYNLDGRFKPFDLPAAHIFKVGADGKIHEIEAMGFTAPYNSPSGWEKWQK